MWDNGFHNSEERKTGVAYQTNLKYESSDKSGVLIHSIEE